MCVGGWGSPLATPRLPESPRGREDTGSLTGCSKGARALARPPPLPTSAGQTALGDRTQRPLSHPPAPELACGCWAPEAGDKKELRKEEGDGGGVLPEAGGSA